VLVLLENNPEVVKLMPWFASRRPSVFPHVPWCGIFIVTRLPAKSVLSGFQTTPEAAKLREPSDKSRMVRY
jgi:hypothetical protein